MSGKLGEMRLSELRWRRRMGRALICKCEGEWADDARAQAAIERLRGQMAELTEEIQRRLYPEGPPDQTIGLARQSLGVRRH